MKGTIRSLSHRRRLTGYAPLDFNLNTLSVTTAAAKRVDPSGVFPAGILIQGNIDGTGTGDALSISRGSQVASYWYDHLDPYQGSIVFWITPEWDGDDGLFHNMWGCWGAGVQVHKYTDDKLWITIDEVTQCGVSTSGWTAGTTYCVIARWDTKNRVDGSNFACVTVDGAHTFGHTPAPVATAAPNPIAIGNNWNNQSQANAIISGLHVFRRVLFDGTYGVDVGNGNEVALISAGADPLRVTNGSWDCVFAMPSNGSTGALVTGEGEAHSHPHGSAVLADTFAQTTYGSSGWSISGTPSDGPGSAANNSKIDKWAYEWVCDAANEGIEQSVVGADAGQSYAVRLLAHEASSGVTGSEMLGNPDMEDWTDGVIDDWTVASGSVTQETVDVQNGSSSAKLTVSGSSSYFRRSTIAVTPGVGYRFSFYAKLGTASTVRGWVNDTTYAAIADENGLTPAGWTQYNLDFWPRTATVHVYLQAYGDGGTAYFDNCSLKPLDADDIRLQLYDDTNSAAFAEFPDFDFGGGSGPLDPGVALVTFQLPTVARQGVASDCTDWTIRILGTAAGQRVFMHQCEVQKNLIDNPSLEVGAGDPFIPTGWTNATLEAGDAEAEAAIVHHGVGSLQWNGASAGHQMWQNTGSNKFICVGGWFYGDGTYSVRLWTTSIGHGHLQSDVDSRGITGNTATSWGHSAAVWDMGTGNMGLLAENSLVGPAYVDGLYAIAQNPVSATVTPSSYENCLEQGGVRVAGMTYATQPVEGKLGPSRGQIRWRQSLRHDPSVASAFYYSGSAIGYHFFVYGDADNFITLYSTGDNAVVFSMKANGTIVGTNWNWSAQIDPNQMYGMEVKYDSSRMLFLLDGTVRGTISPAGGIRFVWTDPVIYWGTNQGKARQGDSVFAAP